MSLPVRIAVRVYEIDAQGHVNGVVYLNYAEHARWEYLNTAGITQAALHAEGVSPVRLEENIRYHQELRLGDEVQVGCTFHWGEGKTFRLHHEFRRDDALVAEITAVGGVLDLATRRLVPDPQAKFRSLATAPELIGG